LHLVQQLREHCRGLVAFPAARRLRPELGEGVRLSVLGNYVVHEDILEIRRAAHGARDLADLDRGTSGDARAVTLDENT
jgi:plasmid stabilization system protein ParE